MRPKSVLTNNKLLLFKLFSMLLPGEFCMITRIALRFESGGVYS